MISTSFVKEQKRARAALESSSKRGSFDRISKQQEFWSVEMGHLTYNIGIERWRFWEKEKISQNWVKLLENPSNNRKIWSGTWKTVYNVILLQEQYGRCSGTVYCGKNSIAQHPCNHYKLFSSKSDSTIPNVCLFVRIVTIAYQLSCTLAIMPIGHHKYHPSCLFTGVTIHIRLTIPKLRLFSDQLFQ